MIHRGPDADGVWADPSGRCTLGHRRLSIIDTSDAGRQPMHSNDGEWSISFNGEIYNFLELRRELEGKGLVFRGRTDTEVLLAGLATWGENIFSKLDGMFAFAAFHLPSGQLFLARDPFGEKPLYYFRTDEGGLAFASELQCLEEAPGFSPEISADAITELLMFQYIGAPRTIYRNVFKLSPGHYMRVRGKDVEVRRYFQFEPGAKGFSEAPRSELADELESILVKSLERRLISDVPLGAFLSGGVDSSTVCALARRKLGVPLQTFSIGFQDDRGSEHEIARQLAAHLGTEHRDQIVSPSAFQFLDHAGTLLDEPNADSSCLPTYLLTQFARQHVTVALSGDGGDELFGGYGRYFDTVAEERTEARRKNSSWSAGKSYYGFNRITIFSPIQAARLLGFLPLGAAEHIQGLMQTIDRPGSNLLHRLRVSDVENYMPGAVLPKVDRMSMQHSMEVRTPFLNVELARFAEKVPAEYLVEGSKGKLLLRDIAYRYLPREIMDLPKKGFGLPLTAGWGQAALVASLQKSLSEDSILGNWIGRERAQRFISGQASHEFSIYQAWTVIMLANWLEKRPAILPEAGAFAAISEDLIAEHLGFTTKKEFRMGGFIAPKTFAISSRSLERPDPGQRIDLQFGKNDRLRLWRVAQEASLDYRLGDVPAEAWTFIFDGDKDVVAAIQDARIDLSGCTLISLDPDADWIRLGDIQRLRTMRLRHLLMPARYAEDGRWIRYDFQHLSPLKRLLNFATLIPTAVAAWRRHSCHTGHGHHHATPRLDRLDTPPDHECVLEYALFEGPSQLLPFISSHQEIGNSDERRYSVWNKQVYYSLPPVPRRWFARPFYEWNYIVPITEKNARRLPVVSRILPLGDYEGQFWEALRNLIHATNLQPPQNRAPESIVLYTHGLSAGGAERQWCNLALGLKAIGKRVCLVVDSLDGVNGHYLTLAKKGGVEVLQASQEDERDVLNFLSEPHYVTLFDPLVFPAADKLSNLVAVLNRLKPDALVAQLDWTNITAGIAGLITDIPQVVFSFRNYNPSHFDYLDNPWLLPLYRELVKSCRIVLTGNSRLGNLDYAHWMGIEPSKIHLLKNAYEPDGFQKLEEYEKQAFLSSLGITADTKIIFGAFRLAREKNPHLFVDACLEVLHKHKNVVALLCGEGTMQHALEEKISSAGMSTRLRLLGRRSDIWKFLSVADVLLLTSNIEGTPNIVREALMVHCPVVSTACGAVPEMIEDGGYGLLAPLGDTPTLVAHLTKVLFDAEFRTQLVERIKSTPDIFTPKDKAMLLMDILQCPRPRPHAWKNDVPAVNCPISEGGKSIETSNRRD